MHERFERQAAGSHGVKFVGIGLYLLAISYLLVAADRATPEWIVLAAALSAPGYVLLIRQPDARLNFWIGLGLRLLALLAFPRLSEDVYRFIWDGALWWSELHPLDATPLQVADSVGAGAAFAKTHDGLLAAMNSRNYFTVYPPGSQLVFALGGLVAGTPWLATLLIKVVLLLGDLAVLGLLRRLAPDRPWVAYVYWLHPAIVVELAGNAHFEGLALAGMLWAVMIVQHLRGSTRADSLEKRVANQSAIVKLLSDAKESLIAPEAITLPQNALSSPSAGQFWRKLIWSPSVWLAGFALATGVLIKLVPLLAAPALTLRLLGSEQGPWARLAEWRFGEPLGRRSQSLKFAAALLGIIGLGFGLMLRGADLSGFGESLNLYFQKFEFNGSLYLMARAWGIWYRGWNWIEVIGPRLAMLGIGAILLLSFVGTWRGWKLEHMLLWTYTIYLLCATTVHPWYFAYLIGLGALTGHRWPLLLGFTGFLSYLAYGENPVEVPIWASLVEYGSVAGLAGYEAVRLKNRAQPVTTY